MGIYLSAHVVLAAASLWAASPPGKPPVDAGTAALERMSDSQRAYAESLAKAYGARPEDVALLRQNGFNWDDAGRGATLAAGWNMELSQVAGAFAAGHSWDDVHEAAKLSVWSGFSFGTVLAMREAGLSWPEVAAQVKVEGIEYRDAPRDPDPPKKKAVPAKKKAPKKAPGAGPGA